MRSVFCLLVHLRIEVRVKNNHSVCHLQVQALPTCSGREQEHAELRVDIVENHHVFMSLVLLHCTVQFEMLNAPIVQELAHNSQQLSELRENEDFVPRSNHFGQHSVK